MFASRQRACFSRHIRRIGLNVKGIATTNGNDWNSKIVRHQFLDFFCKEHEHQFVKSSAIIPGQDEGIYFTNAGMNQFKPIFLDTVPDGSDLASYRRVANSQKCIRVGGKHNDLEDVGHDLTHHTFFEMLGSWSFGDYFKKEACSMALDLLVNVYKLPIDRLYVTYFGGNTELGLQPDLDCKEIWLELGIPVERVLPFGMQDNFWDMGNVGPCGPCTEIHYDHLGYRDASTLVNTGSPDVVEIWNLVFMQYNRLGPGKLLPLPSTHVDTGMGLERLCAVLQGTSSNYNTDLFRPIFDLIQQETGILAYRDRSQLADTDGLDTAYRIIADHVRMACVCIGDGLLPGTGRLEDNERKLRSVIHRALYQCVQVIKARPGLLGRLVHPVVNSLGEAYPEIADNSLKIEEVLHHTEEQYMQMYNHGNKAFRKFLTKNPDVKTLQRDDMMKLREGYYGATMSHDILELIAKQHRVTIDDHACHLPEHVSQVAQAWEVHYPCFTAELVHDLQNSHHIPATDDDHKYQYGVSSNNTYEFGSHQSDIVCLVDERNRIVDQVEQGCKVGVLTRQTPFYAEKGGQAGDIGTIKSKTGDIEVKDTQCSHGYVLHTGTVVNGYLHNQQPVTLAIDPEHRIQCMMNHTATHLVNAACRKVLGSDVCQRGSSVVPNKLTFDFSCMANVTDAHIEEIERMVSTWVADNFPVTRSLVPLKTALQDTDLVYLQNVAYPSEVYMVKVDNVPGMEACTSTELCGGTHVHKTGDLHDFCISSLTGHTSTTKSIVCLTGQHATQSKNKAEELKCACAELELKLKSGISHLEACVTLQKQINYVLGTAVLPKIAKDEIRQTLDLLGTEINTLLNKQAFLTLQNDIASRMADDTVDFIVQEFAVKVIPKLSKWMKKLPIQKPLILVVETSNNVVAYVAFPKVSSTSKSSQEEVVANFCDSVNGKVVERHQNYDLVKGQDLERFIKAAHNVKDDYNVKKTTIKHS